MVEDNLVNQKMATLILEKKGHSVVVANNGLDGVEKHKTGDFDLILMDVQNAGDGWSGSYQSYQRI